MGMNSLRPLIGIDLFRIRMRMHLFRIQVGMELFRTQIWINLFRFRMGMSLLHTQWEYIYFVHLWETYFVLEWE